MACVLSEKARWGKDGGPGGKETPLCASRDRRRPQAVPVATKEATGIDSRDEGVPLPLNLNPQPVGSKPKHSGTRYFTRPCLRLAPWRMK